MEVNHAYLVLGTIILQFLSIIVLAAASTGGLISSIHIQRKSGGKRVEIVCYALLATTFSGILIWMLYHLIKHW